MPVLIAVKVLIVCRSGVKRSISLQSSPHSETFVVLTDSVKDI
jgi:hypothetical protein